MARRSVPRFLMLLVAVGVVAAQSAAAGPGRGGERKARDGKPARKVKTKRQDKAGLRLERSPGAQPGQPGGAEEEGPEYSAYLVSLQPTVYFATNVAAALRYAQDQDRPVLVLTLEPYSGRDRQMEADIFTRPSVGHAARGFVALKLSIAATQRLIRQAAATHPALYLLDPQTGRALAEPLIGYFTAGQVLHRLEQALRAFAALRAERQRAILVAEHASPAQKRAAIDRLAAYQDRGSYGLVRAVATDRSADRVVRSAAIDAMERIGGPEAVADLAGLIDQPDRVVQRAAVRALARRSLDQIDELIEQLCSRDPQVRVEAAGALAVVVSPELVGPAGFWLQASPARRIRVVRRLQHYSASLRQRLRTSAGIETSPSWSRPIVRDGRIARATIEPGRQRWLMRIETLDGSTIDLGLPRSGSR